MILGCGGTLGEPRVFQALVGREVPHERKTVSGVKLMFQPFTKVRPIIRNILMRTWGDEFLGAHCLVEKEDAQEDITFYNIDDELVETIFSRLSDWNLHDADWFRLEGINGEADGSKISFVTEKICDENSLEEASGGYRSASEYIHFVEKMIRKLEAAFGTSLEGVQTSGTERK